MNPALRKNAGALPLASVLPQSRVSRPHSSQ
jgi:hypothetical protein